MTEDPPVDPCTQIHSAQIHSARILDERLPDDRAVLAALREDPRIEVLDLRPRQRDDLRRLLPPPPDELLNEPHRWVYYPWRRTVVGMLGPTAFRTVRLDLNRNKITRTEQERFRGLTIGVVGLSVGHVVAHTLALEGLCGELRLVDDEVFESTNLNRIPATMLDLGVSKVVVIARRIAEIDPYLTVRVFPTDFTQEVSDAFMPGLDLVVEESFSLHTKVLVRAAARANRIPLVMAASNRGLLDVERFDLEPNRQLFHGLLSDSDVADILRNPFQEDTRYHVKMLESEKLSPRLIASRSELGRTLSHWPQLGSELQLAGATVATAVRRIGMDALLRSGRIRVDLEDMLDQVRDPSIAISDGAGVPDATTRKNLDVLVTRIAARLMGVDITSMTPITHAVLAELREFFGVDHVSLRHNDGNIRAAVLVAEWPVREVIPDPDPFAIIYFDTADDWDARGEYAVEPRFGRRGSETWLAAPLVDGGESLGVLTLAKAGKHVWDADAINTVMATAALFATLKKRLEAEERLRYNAAHDDLTDLSNRRALIEYMGKRFESGMPGPVTTMFVDLDRLKALNDFLGHSAGDAFIRTVALRLREHAAPNDMIARLGGDEFVVIPAGQLDAIGAEAAAKRIQAVIGERVEIGGEQVSRSVSIGVAVCIPGEDSVSDVLRQADQAMLAAKLAGGNGIALFTDEMRAERELRDDIELHLRHAVETDTLVLHYQPEVDLRTGQILAVEALVRWNHPTRGLLYPGTFIEIAEATNLAGELGRWVIRNACKQLAQWRDMGIAEGLVMRINVSPVQLVSLDFVSSVETVLDEYSLEGSSVCFEITEHVVVQDLHRTRVTLEGLDKIGASVAIDDFGTGHSSLTHLKDLDVDALKIDRGFVIGLGKDTDDLAIVKSVVELARSLDLDIVAEGVETAVAARTLMALGCNRAQGHLISVPVQPDALTAALMEGVIPVNFSATAD